MLLCNKNAKSIPSNRWNILQPVNVDDINQLLAYHEVFGKLQGTEAPAVAPPPTVKTPESDPDPPASPPGTHVCDLCNKVFPYRYQVIVHRRYHTERKPFQCQVTHSLKVLL